MPRPQQILDLERVLRTVTESKAAMVILVGDDGELETATKGIDNDAALFEICFSVARQLAAELFDDLPEETRRNARLILPTREDALRLGVLGKPRA